MNSIKNMKHVSLKIMTIINKNILSAKKLDTKLNYFTMKQLTNFTRII